MKRKLMILLSSAIMLAIGSLGGSTKAAAAADYTNTELKITAVPDINADFPATLNELNIFNATYDTSYGANVYKITLGNDGYVSLAMAAGEVKKTTLVGAKTTNSEATLTATIYRDSNLLYPVAASVTAKGGTLKKSAERIALDAGDYYIVIQSDIPRYPATGTNVIVQGKAVFIVYYQKVYSDESYRPSYVGLENILNFENVYKSLLTVPNPKDYYRFDVKDKSLVKINFMYSSKKSAKFVLYGIDREELVTKTFTGNSVWYNVEKYLEPGTYYCSLETVTLNDGGETSILLNQTVYPLVLDKENGATNSYITVETIDQPTEIRWVKGKLTNSELASNKWKSGKIITDTRMFGVNMRGYYTVRVMDEYGNMFMQSINVTECDKKAPKKPVIKTYLVNTQVVSGTAEKDSLITVTVNGKPYTCVASSKGNYKCTIRVNLLKGDIIEVSSQDISGNISTRAEVIVK
ncbi:MAG TPA: Ig-like domain-containing protein [Mobilitalea sp.]|nr:Ig-like domain-containing protein [Mobilitalea sp.]